MFPTPAHPLDAALALECTDGPAGHYSGQTSPAYWNMVGPFGGTTAALVIQSVLQHPDLLGGPIAFTINYAAAITEGAFEIHATPVRTNRSTQHWLVQLLQADADGHLQTNTTATVVSAVRRETWGATDLLMPPAPPPNQVQRLQLSPRGVAWIQHYELRPVLGPIPMEWNGNGAHSESLLWLRDAQPRALDFCSLAALSDMFYPRIWLRRATPVAAGTVSITTYLHADAAQLAEVGTGHVLGRAVGQQFCNGFFDQAAQLWSQAGQLLATSNQIVYYKE